MASLFNISKSSKDTFDIPKLLKELTIQEKISLLAGRDNWHTVPIPRLGIPSLRTSDGPNGIRGTRFFEGVPASCFPSATGLGASWDIDLLKEVGIALGLESKAKGAHVLLGPTINIQRSPLGGRGFESYSEDPLLSGTLAKAYIEGVQSEGVAATIKHYVANDQEKERMSMSSEASLRALREIYLRAFEIPIRGENPPWAVMTSYNRVNGLHASENEWLLNGVLRTEWAWRGLVMSDWFGIYSSAEAIRAGLDLEMPGPTVVRGSALIRMLAAGKVFEHDIDARVTNVLELANKVLRTGIPGDAPENSLDTPEIRAAMRKAASSAVVLLKNKASLLPLTEKSPIKSIAVIGPDTKTAVISGGGSAALRPTYTVTPFDAISEAAKEVLGIQKENILYARGGNAHKFAPLFGPELRAADGTVGVDAHFYNEDPLKNPNAKPAHTMICRSTNMFFNDGLPDASVLNIKCWAEFKGTFTPEATGKYEFGVAAAGQADLYVDGKLLLDNSTNPIPGELYFNTGSEEVTGTLDLIGGKAYSLLVRFHFNPQATQAAGSLASDARGGVRFGVAPLKSVDQFVAEAVDVAKKADVAVLVVGLNADFESEGYDRPHMRLPSSADTLVAAVLAANPNTVVVIQSGTPVEMPWVEKASTLVQAFYGGNEVGHGISDVLFGKVNPSGRLPLSFPKRLEDNPSYLNFGGENGKVHYAEGIFVGYRHYEKSNASVLFPFGYGLSYTTFNYSAAKLSASTIKPDGSVTVSVKVTNTGSVAGREVVQVYVKDVEASLQRPVKELKAFAKTSTLEPGASETVSVTLDRYSLGFFDDHVDVEKWVAEKGAFKVLVASTLTDVKAELDLELTETFRWI